MSYLRNCWYVAGFPAEIAQRPVGRIFLDEPVLLLRTESGALAAMDNRCPHRFAPLDRGIVVGETIQCPYHGLRFGTEGQCVHMPNGGDAPPRARLKVYPLVERHALLWIWMGDADAADPELIPDFSYLVDDAFGWFDGTLYARSNYQLLVDNLLDLSHSEFLHPFLNSDGWAGRNIATIEQKGGAIHVNNVAENDNVLPIMAKMRPDLPTIGTTIQHERWNEPSLIRLSVEFYSEGKQIVIPSGHFLTPETGGTTHYFVRGGQDVAPANDEFTAGVRAGVMAVFQTEDIPLIEAQQRFLGDVDLMAAGPAILKGDAAAVRARRLLAKRIRDEAAGTRPLPATRAPTAEPEPATASQLAR